LNITCASDANNPNDLYQDHFRELRRQVIHEDADRWQQALSCAVSSSWGQIAQAYGK